MGTSGILKKTLILLSIMVGLLLGIGFMLPSSFSVERSLIIEAKPTAIYPWVANLKKWPRWDPWGKADKDLADKVRARKK